jgi:hypothetical protein
MEEQDLQAFVRKPFTVYLAGAKVELELIDVRALPPQQVPGLRRNPFKLLFRGPPVRHYTEALPRQVHELHAADGGYFRSTWNRSLAPASLGCCTKQFLTSPHFSHPVKNAHGTSTSVGVNADPAQTGSGLAAKDFAPAGCRSHRKSRIQARMPHCEGSNRLVHSKWRYGPSTSIL